MGRRAILLLAVAVFLIVAVAPACAQNDLDNYKFRIDADWWFSQPTGYFGLRDSSNYFDLHHDFGFGSYSTFTGKIVPTVDSYMTPT